jgi:Leucine-rich repeat (LRR) protein
MRRIGTFLLVAAGIAGTLSAAEAPDWIAKLGGKVQRDSAGNVVAVNLRGTWVDDVEMVDLAKLPKLQKLDLSHTRISDEGMLNLKPATQIQDLNLYYSEWITDQGISAIKNWKNLKHLDVRGTRISNGTLEIVSHMPQLESLDISNTQVTEDGMDALIALTSLKQLSIGQGRLNGDLGFLRMLPTLVSLDIGGAKPTPPDMGGGRRGAAPVQPLSQNTMQALLELKNLHQLRLGFSGITAPELKQLSALQGIEKLGLQECPRVDDAAAAELASWKGLKYVDLQGTKVTDAGVDALRKAKPGLVVLDTLHATVKDRPTPPTPSRD